MTADTPDRTPSLAEALERAFYSWVREDASTAIKLSLTKVQIDAALRKLLAAAQQTAAPEASPAGVLRKLFDERLVLEEGETAALVASVLELFAPPSPATPAAAGESGELREALDQLDKAAGQFAFYADQHAAKGTREADDKAAVNHQWALTCARKANTARQALAALRASDKPGEAGSPG